MTKHEVLARVWPEVFVDEGILTVHVSALRKALTTLQPRVRRCLGPTDPPSCTNSWVAADPAMDCLGVGPQWDPLRRDARFADRLRAILPAGHDSPAQRSILDG